MNLEVTGTIRTIEDIVEGTGKDGKPWQKLTYTVVTDEQYNNLYAFEVFSQEKVEQFKQYNNVGDKVTVKFNVSTNEWKGKYFTTLSSWRCSKDSTQADTSTVGATEEEIADDSLPF